MLSTRLLILYALNLSLVVSNAFSLSWVYHSILCCSNCVIHMNFKYACVTQIQDQGLYLIKLKKEGKTKYLSPQIQIEFIWVRWFLQNNFPIFRLLTRLGLCLRSQLSLPRVDRNLVLSHARVRCCITVIFMIRKFWMHVENSHVSQLYGHM